LPNFEAELLDSRVGQRLLYRGEQALLLEREFLHHETVGGSDFERAAGDLSGFRDGGNRRARGGLPGFAVSLVGSDLGVASLLYQLGKHIGDALRLVAEKAAPLLLAAAVEIFQFFGGEVYHEGSKDTKCGGRKLATDER
jgi:hypothetical protein